MTGIDPEYKNFMNESFSQLLHAACDRVIDNYGPPGNSRKSIAKRAVKRELASALAEHQKKTDAHAEEKYASPIMDMTKALPKSELANLAEALVNLTSFKRRVSLDVESVGGAIDVAVISKGDGFIWIKKKRYFEGAQNRSFFTNDLRSTELSEGTFARERVKQSD